MSENVYPIIYCTTRFIAQQPNGYLEPVDFAGVLVLPFLNTDPAPPREGEVWMRGNL